MPVNRNALIRYKTIDKCLQNRYRKWTLEDLIDACSDALYEYEGIDKGVSKRTVQGDIQIMRSNKLGYNAPITVEEKKYYTYEDAHYSITNIPLTDQDLGMLTDAVQFMKQFRGFSHFRELEGMVQKLEDHIYSQKTKNKPVIDFEKNDNLKGLKFLDKLYKSIIKKEALNIEYKSFKARESNNFDFHPYLLKEYRNRWFLIGKKEDSKGIMNLALDRIISVKESKLMYEEEDDFDPSLYYRDTIGVSVSSSQAIEKIVLHLNKKHAPYVITKPLHWSQEVIEEDYYGITISLMVQHNFELEKELLGFGEGLKVIAPLRLRRKIKERHESATELYHHDLNTKGLNVTSKKIKHKGFALLNRIFTQREIKKILQVLKRHFGEDKATDISEGLFEKIKPMRGLLINRNLNSLLRTISPEFRITKTRYFHRVPESEKNKEWHQTVSNKELQINIYLDDYLEEDGCSACCPAHILRFIKSQIYN